jgi:hypothetical protein
MKFLKNLYKAIAWKLWRRRVAIGQMKRLIDAGPPTIRNNPAVYKTISKEDMNIGHYDRRTFPLSVDNTDLN